MNAEFEKLIALLIFFAVILGMQLFLVLYMSKTKTEWEHENVVRFVGLTIIIGAALIIVLTGVKGEYIAAIVGLLGTIAGGFLRPIDRPTS